MRKTMALREVAAALMQDPAGRHYGYGLGKASRVRSAVMYPILSRLLKAGWLEDGWEDIDPRKEGRPPRRYYTVTRTGQERMAEMLEMIR